MKGAETSADPQGSLVDVESDDSENDALLRPSVSLPKIISPTKTLDKSVREKKALPKIETSPSSNKNLGRWCCEVNHTSMASKVFIFSSFLTILAIIMGSMVSSPLEDDIPSGMKFDCKMFSDRPTAEIVRLTKAAGINDPAAEQDWVPWVNGGDKNFSNARAYFQLRSSCRWTTLKDHHSTLDHYTDDNAYNSNNYHYWGLCQPPNHCPMRSAKAIQQSRMFRQRCNNLGGTGGYSFSNSSSRDNGFTRGGNETIHWTIERVGPISGTGGYDWSVGGSIKNIGLLSKEIKANGGELFVVGSATFPTDKNGEPLGHPPIHIHHFHIHTRKSWLAPIIEAHGDSECHGAYGGINCLVRMLPNGVAHRITSPLYVDFVLDDVRPKGSPTMEYYMEIAIAWTRKRPQKGVGSKISFIAPAQRHGPLVYGIPPQKSCVFWYSHTFRHNGSFIPGQFVFHAHQSRTQSFWAFSGPDVSRDILGLTKLEQQAHPNSSHVTKLPYIPEHFGSTLEDVKKHILDHIVQATKSSSLSPSTKSGVGMKEQLSPVCVIEAPCLEKEPAAMRGSTAAGVGNGEERGSYGWYDRRSHIQCRRWTPKRGDTLIVVAFNHGHRFKGSHGMGKADNVITSFPQHCGLRGLFIPDDLDLQYSMDPAIEYMGNCKIYANSMELSSCRDAAESCRDWFTPGRHNGNGPHWCDGDNID
mmetsp:Transcript_20675/g.33941  ORF Transcript_20675/g.33941 Transcript_20675/m.33941 type:complete len:698 (+) Transcript_20675:169-2262(+)